MKEQSKLQPPILIPKEELSPDILDAVIGQFLEREGTDYGAVEATGEIKFRQIHQQIASGKVVIVFDPNTETVTLVTKDFWQKNAEH